MDYAIILIEKEIKVVKDKIKEIENSEYKLKKNLISFWTVNLQEMEKALKLLYEAP